MFTVDIRPVIEISVYVAGAVTLIPAMIGYSVRFFIRLIKA